MEASMMRVARAARSAFMVSAVALALGCGDDDGEKAGAPQLQQALALANDEATDLLVPPDGGIPPLSPLLKLKLVFDKLLDGDKIEHVDDAGMPMALTDVATIAWADKLVGAPEIVAATTYSPNGNAATKPAPSIWISASPGLPSGAKLMLRLDRSKITDRSGQAFAGADMVPFETEPFSAALNVDETMPVASDFKIEVTFSNLPGADADKQIQVTAGGVAVAVTVSNDPTMNARLFTVAPATGGWVAGRSYTVTVGKQAKDLFGVALAETATATFSAGSGGADGGLQDSAAADGAPDGGQPDAAPADGGADLIGDAASGS
jgi:hypothetical protein